MNYLLIIKNYQSLYFQKIFNYNKKFSQLTLMLYEDTIKHFNKGKNKGRNKDNNKKNSLKEGDNNNNKSKKNKLL